MSNSTDVPVTLGDKLKSQDTRSLGKSILALLVSAIIGALFWWAIKSPLAGIVVLVLCRLFFGRLLFGNTQSAHFLLHADREGFMKSLKLADKTAIFDGNNIYHFGLDHGIGVRALKTLVQNLRADGYRIVCFFDANIYFTLRKNGAFLKGAPFSVQLLQTAFDLKPNEIYVVPSRIQADRFIIESLSHFPDSFVVTNDQFRDFFAEYDFLTKIDWRKGIEMEQGKLQLENYRFKEPMTFWNDTARRFAYILQPTARLKEFCPLCLPITVLRIWAPSKVEATIWLQSALAVIICGPAPQSRMPPEM